MRIRLLACTSVLAIGFSTVEAQAQETTTYQYDALGRLTGSSISGGPNSSIATVTCFDPAGNRTQYFTGTSGAPACGTPTPTPGPTPTPTPNQSPTCTTLTIGPIPGYATSTINVTAAMILGKSSDPDGGTLSVTSPAVPYTISVLGNGQPITRTHTVSDGQGGTATMTINVTRY